MRTIVSFFLLTVCAQAEVTLAPLFSDHVVLQREKPLPVWGRADPGEHVTVKFGEQEVGATAAPDGRWLVVLDAIPASSTPAELTVSGKNTLHVADVLVGDVWLCSGQSNMEFPVSRAQNAEQEIASANYPLIRHNKIKQTVSSTPADSVEASWVTCSPATVGDFTAVGFFFARDLQPRLNIPIGLINSTWGGTPVEAWMSAAAFASNPAFSVVDQRWQQTLADYPRKKIEYDAAIAAWTVAEAAAKGRNQKFTQPKPQAPQGPGHSYTPSGLFNGMINPLAPYALRGFLWYQGETNTSRPTEYAPLFATLIRTWRQHFGQADLPFFWVQLAGFKYSDPFNLESALLREAQTNTLSLPATGQALTIDIGDKNDIHPRNKQEVGRRLALLARAKVYDMPVDFSGPVFAGFTHEGSALRVHFTHAGTGLTARDKPLQSLQIAGADRRFYWATAKIDRDSILVSAKEVAAPVAVRYAWFNAPEANLYNGAGLPAAPFRSDDW